MSYVARSLKLIRRASIDRPPPLHPRRIKLWQSRNTGLIASLNGPKQGFLNAIGIKTARHQSSELLLRRRSRRKSQSLDGWKIKKETPWAASQVLLKMLCCTTSMHSWQIENCPHAISIRSSSKHLRSEEKRRRQNIRLGNKKSQPTTAQQV